MHVNIYHARLPRRLSFNVTISSRNTLSHNSVYVHICTYFCICIHPVHMHMYVHIHMHILIYTYANRFSLYRTHCNTLQHTATHVNTLQPNAAQVNTLQHTAKFCRTFVSHVTHFKTSYHGVFAPCVGNVTVSVLFIREPRHTNQPPAISRSQCFPSVSHVTQIKESCHTYQRVMSR